MKTLCYLRGAKKGGKREGKGREKKEGGGGMRNV